MRFKFLVLSVILFLSATTALQAHNNALCVNGESPVNDYVLLGNNVYNQMFNGSEGISFEGFINLSYAPLAPYSRVLYIGMSPSQVGFAVSVTTNGQLMCHARSSAADTNTSFGMTSAGLIGLNQWYRVAAVVNFTAPSIKLFINGVDVTLSQSLYFSSASYQAGTGDNEYIGMWNSQQYYRGQVDEFRLWDYARTADEILADINGELTLPRDGLIGYWMFNELSGTTAVDSSGNGVDGTLVNFPADPWVGINLSITPVNTVLEYDETVTLTVNISDVRWFDPLRGFEMQINYDPDHLIASLADFTEGPFLSSFASVYGLGTQFYVSGENGAWIVSCAILSVPPGSQVLPFGASGDGELFSVTLTALHNPSCYDPVDINLSGIILRNEINHPIYPDYVAGAIVNIRPTLVIPLNTGWNIISSWVIPENMAVEAVYQELKDSGYLVKVQDEVGNAYEETVGGAWVNNIGNYQMTEGYNVLVNTDCDLVIHGVCVNLPMSVPLYQGWNIIPYPYKDPTAALAFLQVNMDTSLLLKVQDEQGFAIEPGYGGTWIDQIGELESGEGYYLYVTENTTITFPLP
jgi:hypothetical protein